MRGTLRSRRSRRPLTTWSLRLLAAYGVTATLLLLAIAVFRDSWVLTYVAALLFFWWLVPAPLSLVLALVARGWVVALTVLAPTAVCVVLLGPYLVHDLPGTLPSGPADLRVATYNLSNGRPLDGLTELVRNQHPDVLLLQEVTNTHDELARLLPAYPAISAGTGVNGPGHDGYAVASRFPIRSVTPVTGLPSGARPTDVVTLDVRGHEVAVISVHLASPCLDCAPGAPNPAGDTAQASRVRVAEARRYAEVAGDLVHPRRAVIVAGDLNASPLNQPLGELTATGLVDAQAAVGRSPGLTRGPGPGVARVDVVLVSGLEPVRAFDGSRGSSDHAPVIADLRWPSADFRSR